jgi:hypothetical protein
MPSAVTIAGLTRALANRHERLIGAKDAAFLLSNSGGRMPRSTNMLVPESLIFSASYHR